MTDPRYVLFGERGAIALTGPDRSSFLQGLVSNDVTKVGPARAVYAALLTPQGKFLHDFFLVERDEALLLDCEAPRLADLKRRLGLFKLRSKIALDDASDRFTVGAVFGDGALAKLGLPNEAGSAIPFAGGVACVDPRLPAMGVRCILPRESAAGALADAGIARDDGASYDRLRLEIGLPDGSRDMEVEKAILLENGFDELNGVDWKKGCYMGQELTARTKYRGLIKKRLMPVAVDGPLPTAGTLVMLGDQEAGEMRSGRDRRALALLRLEAVETAAKNGAALMAGAAKITPLKTSWANF